MVKPKLLYTDKAGNKLYVRYIKTRDAWQWTGKNAEGKIIKSSDVRILMQRALRDRASQWGRTGDHEMAAHLRGLVRKLPKAKPVPTKSKKWRIQDIKMRVG